jgi:EpsI family protein
MGSQARPFPGGRRGAVAGLLLLAGLCAAYANTFAEMWIRWFPAWSNPSAGLYHRITGGESYYTHGPLVPLVSLIALVLLIRHTRIPLAPRPVLGFALVLGSLLVHMASCFARVNFVSGFSLIGLVAGLTLMLWGAAALRRLWFPIAFLAFMVPLPEVSIAQLNFRLKLWTADWGVALANLVGVIAERSGNQVFLEGGKTLIIANVCNGLRTLISLLAFGALYAQVCKLRGVWRLALFAFSVPVAVVSNAIRITSLIVVADVWDEATATGWYHDTSGILIYGVAFLLMFGFERLVLGARQWIGRPAVILPLFHGVLRGPEDEGQWGRLARAFGTPAGWTAAVLVLAVAGGAWALNRTVPSVWKNQMARAAMPMVLEMGGRSWQGTDLEMDETTLAILETRDYLLRRYTTAGAAPVDFCIVFSRDNRKGTHPPDICLEGGGQEIVQKRDVALRGVEGRGDLVCRELVAQRGSHREYFLYVYKCGNSYTTSFWRQQFGIFVNGLLARNASGALIRVSTSAGDDLEAASRRSMMMLSAAVPYLDRALP